jgi:hypothetical protein
MPQITFVSTSPDWYDSEEITLQKLLQETVSGGTTLGSGGIFFGAAENPNGVTTATRPAVYYSDEGSMWLKTNTGNNPSGWEQKF